MVPPLLDVTVADVEDVRLPCLVDSGALHTLLPAWAARVGGIRTARRRPADLGSRGEDKRGEIRRHPDEHSGAWECEVGSATPWPYAWGLLGQVSFFRFFTVTFRVADFEFEVTANQS